MEQLMHPLKELEKIEAGFQRNIAEISATLSAKGKPPADPAVSILAGSLS